jgi:hypothetical protein
MVLVTIFQIVIRLLSLARFLVTSQGDAHPSWSQMLTPKVKPFFRLNFVEDILAIGRMLKLLLCFYSSRKFLVLVRSRDWKNSRFRWFGRAPSVLINHRKCSVSSDKWSIRKASNHRKGFERAKRRLVLSHEPDVKIRCNDEKFKPPKARVVGGDVRSWVSTERF